MSALPFDSNTVEGCDTGGKKRFLRRPASVYSRASGLSPTRMLRL
jgi:hypothetical protein